MKNKKWIWIGLGGVLVLLLIVVNVIHQSQASVQAVQFARVRVEDITSRVRAPGKIEPKTQVKISADLPGKVQRLLVKEGDRVRKGQLMLQLDDTQYRANSNQARAALASAQARLREATAALKLSDTNHARQKALFDQKLLSQAEWDQASTANESVHTTAATAREEVTRAQAMLDGTEDNLGKCRFVAPFDGVVSALNVEQGEVVITCTMNNPGTQILVVSDLSRMLVKADVDETDVVDMKLAQKAKITVDAMPDTSFRGSVIEIGNTAKRSVTSTVEGQTNFEVKVVFEDNVVQIRPGMTADVEIETATHPHTTGVPIQAVVVRTQRELDRAAHKADRKQPKKRPNTFTADEDTVGRREKEITGVFVATKGVAKFVPVRTGIASESLIEIFGDVKPGDLVVAGPYKALRELKPGAKVKQEQPGKGGPGGKS
ncbi:MAG: efflux RND transporter periplasmic adaptor subunit [Candidatus Eisenbacteria bacterium]|nr:efflux RND transporter periplasmic adaptor subunit [Candidatus Eisenbacteria bacterium]